MKKIFSILTLFIYAFSYGQNLHDDHRYLTGTNFRVPDSLVAFGDSYTAGINGFSAGNGFRPDTPDTTYITRLLNGTLGNTKGYNLSFTNRALSGSGIWDAVAAFNANSGASETGLVTLLAGFNDLRRGSVDATYRKIVNGFNTFYCNHYLKNLVLASSGSCTRSGTWATNYNAAFVGGKSGAAGSLTTTLNDSITYVFTDSTIIVGLFGSDGEAGTGGAYIYSNFDVYIDQILVGHFTENNQTDGISDGVYDNKRTAFNIFFTGMTNTAHQIKLINTSGGSANFAVDYFGSFKDYTVATPLLLFHIPYNNVTGYLTSPAFGSVGKTIQANNKIDSVASTWNDRYPFYMVKTEKYYDTLSCLASDDIHPNNHGDIALFNAVMNVLPSVTSSPFGTLMTNNTKRPQYTVNGVIHRLAFLDDLYGYVPGAANSSYIIANPFTTQNAFLDVLYGNFGSGAARIGTQVETDAPFTAGAIAGTTPYIAFYNSGGSTNSKLWDMFAQSTGTLHGRVVNDAVSAANDWITVTRSGTTVSSVAFPGTAVNIAGATLGSNVLAVNGNTAIQAGGVNMTQFGSVAANGAPFTAGQSSVGSVPIWSLFNSSGATDAKIWRGYISGNNFVIDAENDALSAASLGLEITRSGSTVVTVSSPVAPILAGTTSNFSGWLQSAVNTTTMASFFIGGSAVDVTSPTNGMLWYNATTHALNFRDNGATVNLLAGSTSTLQQVITNGNTLTGSNTINSTGGNLVWNLGGEIFDLKTSAANFGWVVGGAAGTNTVQWGWLGNGGTAFTQGGIILDSFCNMSTASNISIGIGGALKIGEGVNGRAGQIALTSGTKAISISGITTSSRAFVTLVSQSGTTTTTIAYIGVCTSNTLTISAVTVAGTNTINTGDASTLNYFVIN